MLVDAQIKAAIKAPPTPTKKIGLKDGKMTLINDQHSVIVVIECDEIKGDVAFRSHNFPDPVPPILFHSADKKAKIIWNEGSFEKSANIPAEKNLVDALIKVVKKRWHEDGEVNLKPEHQNVLTNDINNTTIVKQNKLLTFR